MAHYGAGGVIHRRAHDMKAPLTELIAKAANGERGALDQVFAALYPDLRAIARARLRVHGGVAHLDTTSLVHESYLRLVDASKLSISDRKHFFTYAAKTMRNIAIDFAREEQAQRRGGGASIVALDTEIGDQLGKVDTNATLLRVNDALLALDAIDPGLAQVVEMRYFAGYSETEIGELLGTSERTVRRQWEKARAFLLASIDE
jgi:RNA polymerase sigma factor (TIGR02999 family)